MWSKQEELGCHVSHGGRVLRFIGTQNPYGRRLHVKAAVPLPHSTSFSLWGFILVGAIVTVQSGHYAQPMKQWWLWNWCLVNTHSHAGKYLPCRQLLQGSGIRRFKAGACINGLCQTATQQLRSPAADRDYKSQNIGECNFKSVSAHIVVFRSWRMFKLIKRFYIASCPGLVWKGMGKALQNIRLYRAGVDLLKISQ